MAQKWNLQDIRPSRPRDAQSTDLQSQQVTSQRPLRRPTQDIAPRRPEQRPPQQPPRREEPFFDEDLGTIDITDGHARRRKRTIIAVVLASCVLGAAFGVNVLLGGATVTVYPKFKDVSVQAAFTGEKSPAAGELGYEILTLDATGERQVAATGSETVSERAQGSIFVYNADTKGTQRLIKNTRFESPDGLIYRISESIEVPAASKDAKGAIVPGVVTANVFADGTGDQYNIAPARFTVPGLKGTEQFNTIYAESTVTMSGGFEGERFILDTNELETKKQELHIELRNSLIERLSTERPSGFIVFPDAVTFTFETLPSTSYGNTLATIKEKAYLHVPIFKDKEFAQYLAESTIAGYEGEDVTITEPEKLVFSYANATTTQSDISDDQSIEFLLKGTTRIVWEFDPDKLKSDLVGLAKPALPTVLSGYPAIDRAEAVLRPFWKQEFPEDPNEIVVSTILDKAAAAVQTTE